MLKKLSGNWLGCGTLFAFVASALSISMPARSDTTINSTTNSTVTAVGNVTITSSGIISTSDSAHALVVSRVNATTIDNAGTVQSESAAAIRSQTQAAIINQSGGIIRASSADAIKIASGAADSSIDNSGRIEASGSGNSAIRAEGRASITNQAGGVITAGGGHAIRIVSGAAGSSIDNSGRIEASGSGNSAILAEARTSIINRSGGIISAGGADAIKIASGTHGSSIDNSGRIETTGSGNSAILVQGGATITNQAGGIIRGYDAANAITIRTPQNSLATAVSAITITNAGRIESTGSGTSIAVQGPMGSIRNESGGIIRSARGTAIDIAPGGSITQGIANAGIIHGGGGIAINNRGSRDLTIANSGNIIGDIRFGATSADRLDIHGGTIDGDVIGQNIDRSSVNFYQSFASGGQFVNVDSLNVIGGTLELNHPVRGSRLFSVAPGATVNMNSNVGARSFINEGLVDIKTLQPTISGDFIQRATGSLGLTVTNSGSAGRLVVRGNASLATNSNANRGSIHVTANEAIATGTSYDVLTANSLAASNNLTVTTNSPILGFTSTVGASSLRLTAVENQNSPLRQAAAHAPIASVASLVRRVATDPSIARSRDTDTLLLSNLTEVASAASPVTDIATMSAPVSSATQAVFDDALLKLTPNPALVGGINQATMARSGAVAEAITRRRTDLRLSQAPTTSEDKMGLGLWGQPFAASLTQGRRNGIDGFTAGTAGFVLGGDALVTDKLRLGMAVGFAKTKVDSTSAEADVTNIHGTLYGVYSDGPWFLEGQVGYGNDDFKRSRDTGAANANLIASAQHDANQYSVRLGSGYVVSLSGLEISPQVFAQYTMLRLNGYTETGAGAANLRVGTAEAISRQAGIDLRVAYPIPQSAGVLIPEFRIGYTREFNASQPSVTASFVGISESGGSFATQGASLDQNRLKLGLGVTFHAKENWTLSSHYEHQITSTSHGHAGLLRARYRF